MVQFIALSGKPSGVSGAFPKVALQIVDSVRPALGQGKAGKLAHVPEVHDIPLRALQMILASGTWQRAQTRQPLIPSRYPV